MDDGSYTGDNYKTSSLIDTHTTPRNETQTKKSSSMEDEDTQVPFVHMPDFHIFCKHGNGIAVCPELNVLILSHFEIGLEGTLSVYGLDFPSPPSFMYVLGQGATPPPLQFNLSSTFAMAFTGTAPYWLLVPDTKLCNVHIVDVQSARHCGYLAPSAFSTIPKSVAAKADLVAVASDPDVHLFQRHTAASWTKLWTVKAACDAVGVTFMPDPAQIAVFPSIVHRTKSVVLRTKDGSVMSFLNNIGTQIDGKAFGPRLVIVSYARSQMHWMTTNNETQQVYTQVLHDRPVSLAVLPRVGIFLRSQYCVSVYGTAETVAMVHMSRIRVVWMAAVIRRCALCS